MERCSVSLAIIKMQIKTTVRYHDTTVRMAKFKKTVTTSDADYDVKTLDRS